MEVRPRSLTAALLGVLIIAIASTTPVMGASPPVLWADLEGKPIPTYEVGSHFCHDFAHPVIHCFETSAGLEQAMIGDASRAGSLSASGVIAAYGPNDYVTIYSGPSYAGTFAHLAQNYDSLAVIGWNDTISSFKGRNNRSVYSASTGSQAERPIRSAATRTSRRCRRASITRSVRYIGPRRHASLTGLKRRSPA